MKTVEDIHSIREREAQGTQVPEFVFERVVVPIPSRFLGYVDSLEAKVSHLESELQRLSAAVDNRQLDDQSARALIIKFIREAKRSERREINAFEVAHSLRLPIDQVLKILHRLKPRGLREVK